MPNLPTVGGDSGVWGTELNTWLTTDHNTDGTHHGTSSDLFCGPGGLYAAKGDTRYVTDGVVNGTTTFTSATASFTSADSGKLITIARGGSSEAQLCTNAMTMSGANSLPVSASLNTTNIVN